MQTGGYLKVAERGPHCRKKGDETESLQGASHTS